MPRGRCVSSDPDRGGTAVHSAETRPPRGGWARRRASSRRTPGAALPSGAVPQLPDARLLRCGQTQPEVEAEGLGDFLAKEDADAPTVDTAEQFTAQPPESDSVIGEFESGIILARLLGQ